MSKWDTLKAWLKEPYDWSNQIIIDTVISKMEELEQEELNLCNSCKYRDWDCYPCRVCHIANPNIVRWEERDNG